ncbi:TIGR02281 family clan AA aspartic protease [Hydrogenophaga sp.]|uniref:retropepsin-like aspartic protease family protein n=1 Tax=Hydrogenophaga sp. TaxID=1904254 RepID=UPI002723D185|nr:retropepsin-like aspartic protease [Hydrogenophaga sp.]MDO8902954.1 retropepsin-like aspartic protease [Hydrogenophaga sp.]
MHNWMIAMALIGGSAATTAWAQQVALSGLSGSRALLVIDGAAPRFLSPGQSHQGVKLLNAQGDSATVEVAGQRQTLRVGDAPVSVGNTPSSGGGQRIVLTADARGHFLPQGQINGRSVQFMVDTGATVIAIGEAEAQRLNLNFKEGRPVRISTANGTVNAYQIQLSSVRVGDVQVYDVAAVVAPQPMPYVLLGNSFLTRFQMQRNNDQMTLEKR